MTCQCATVPDACVQKQSHMSHCAHSALSASLLTASLLQDPSAPITEQASEAMLRVSFALAAQYILLSYVLQPTKEVYSKSLQVVRQLLPLPNLRAGRLLAVDVQSIDEVLEKWSLSSFVLNETGFRAATAPQAVAAQQMQGNAEQASPSEDSNEATEHDAAASDADADNMQQPQGYQIELSDIACVKPCNDPSLPPGYAFWVSLYSRTQGLYFVAESSEDAEGWVDALHMICYAAKQGRMRTLSQALGPAQDSQDTAPP